MSNGEKFKRRKDCIKKPFRKKANLIMHSKKMSLQIRKKTILRYENDTAESLKQDEGIMMKPL